MNPVATGDCGEWYGMPKRVEDGTRSECLPFPERRRLAEKMSCTDALSLDEMWAALGDLHSLCCRDSDALCLPGSRPWCADVLDSEAANWSVQKAILFPSHKSCLHS